MVQWRLVGLDFIEFVGLVFHLLFSYAEYIFYRFIKERKLKSLDGEIVVVTGSGRGIGREICYQLAGAGATVVGWSKSAGPNEEMVAEVRRRGGNAHAYTVDVSSREQVELAAVQVKREVGPVTMVVNNAGLMRVKPFLDTSSRDLEALFQVNIMSQFWVLKQFLPDFIDRGHGHIVTVCSAAGLLPTRNLVPYSSTKHAAHGFIESLRDELRHHPKKPDIKITTTYPFYCNTDMLDGAHPNTRFPSLIPIVTPELVAEKLIEGIRAEVPYIYTPALMGYLAMMSWLVPPRANVAWSDYVHCHIDPATAAAVAATETTTESQKPIKTTELTQEQDVRSQHLKRA